MCRQAWQRCAGSVVGSKDRLYANQLMLSVRLTLRMHMLDVCAGWC
jgi:hypothetical protein